MAYTKYSLTPADNNAAPPNGAPEGMLPSAVNDTMRDMMAQIRDVGDGIRGGTYTMTAPVITGGSINGTTIGASTASTGAFSTLSATGVTTVQAGSVSAPAITTTGDTNTGIFFPAADTIAFTEGGTESMRISSTGNLGIGQTSPSYRLDINKGSAGIIANFTDGVAQTLRILTDATTASIDSVSGTNLGFQVGSVERMRITSTGYVGIANTAPPVLGYEKFGVTGSGAFSSTGSTVLGLWNTTNAGLIQFYTGGGTAAGSLQATGAALTLVGGTSLSLTATGANPLIFNTNSGERMRIDSSGRVGIGTDSPLREMVLYRSSGEVHFKIANGTTGQGTGDGFDLAIDSSGGAYLINRENQPMHFLTNETERMRIDSSGNLLVGGTGTGGNLTISGKGSEGWAVKFLTPINSGTYNFLNFCTSGTTQVGSVQSNGSTTSYNTSSDYRLKDNIAPMTGALNVVSALKPCTYTWKADGSDGQGFIAHELAEVVPDCVTGEKDAVNADGSIKPQGIDTSFLVATLTAAIQELKAELDSVKAELQTLKGN
jgi:hypothetical protein